MIFDVNQTEFKNDFQKQIWTFGKSVLPLEVTLVGIEDPETREGFTQVHQFIHDVLEDMYNNPDDDEARKGFGHYVTYAIKEFVSEGNFDESGLRWLVPENKIKNNKFIEKQQSFMKYLKKFGFSCSDEGVFSNEKSPLLLKYWYRMYNKRTKSTEWVNYIWECDFRVFTKEKRRTIEDLLRTLPDKNRPKFQELHDYAISKGAKREPSYLAGYSYKYKNKRVLILGSNSSVTIPTGEWTSTGPQRLESFIHEAKTQEDGDKLIAFIQNAITRCTPQCRYKCGYTVVFDIEGVKRALCINAYCRDILQINPCFNDEDIHLLKRMIDVKLKQVDKL